jgi:hypothetical protein
MVARLIKSSAGAVVVQAIAATMNNSPNHPMHQYVVMCVLLSLLMHVGRTTVTREKCRCEWGISQQETGIGCPILRQYLPSIQVVSSRITVNANHSTRFYYRYMFCCPQ